MLPSAQSVSPVFPCFNCFNGQLMGLTAVHARPRLHVMVCRCVAVQCLTVVVCLQGWRTSMEDAHCAELDMDGKKSLFFGVYDGARPSPTIMTPSELHSAVWIALMRSQSHLHPPATWCRCWEMIPASPHLAPAANACCASFHVWASCSRVGFLFVGRGSSPSVQPLFILFFCLPGQFLSIHIEQGMLAPTLLSTRRGFCTRTCQPRMPSRRATSRWL